MALFYYGLVKAVIERALLLQIAWLLRDINITYFFFFFFYFVEIMPSLNKIFQSTNVANISKRKIRNEELTISLQKIY